MIRGNTNYAKLCRDLLRAESEREVEKLLGQDYEIITADDRLDKLADDFVEHCATRWE